MLIGTYSHALDNKGRVFIPSKWREAVGDLLIVMHWILPGQDQCCLFAMSLNEWDQFSARLSQLPMTDMDAQEVKRRLYAYPAPAAAPRPRGDPVGRDPHRRRQQDRAVESIRA